jgi:hypothetical protein
VKTVKGEEKLGRGRARTSAEEEPSTNKVTNKRNRAYGLQLIVS